MARPKKEPAESKTINTGFADYMRMQNFLAQHLQVQQAMASRMMTAASASLGAINATLSQVQSNTKVTLQLSSISDKEIKHEEYPHIYNLLKAENFPMEPTEGLGELQLPSAPPLPTPAKKQRKVRKPKDPNAPKRPVTAFFLYLAENREAMTRQMGPNAKPGEIQQRNKDMWNSLSEEKQEKYKKVYRENFDTYKKELREYQAKGGVVDPKELEVPEEDDAVPAEPEHDAKTSPSEESDSSSSSDSESSESEAVPSPPKPSKKPKSAKESSPEKKKKADKEEKKKRKSGKERKPSPSNSPEAPKKKRKAESADADAGVDEKKKKKKRKSQGVVAGMRLSTDSSEEIESYIMR